MPIEDQVPHPSELRRWKAVVVTVAVTVAIVAVAMTAGYAAAAAFDGLTGIDQPRAFAPGEIESLTTARVVAALAGFQIVALALALLADRWFHFPGSPLLRFGLPRGGFKVPALAIVALFALATVYTSLVYRFDGQALAHDLGPFVGLLKARTWWMLFLAAAVGAPIAEECLFRGLLYGGLRRTPLGMTGAAILTSLSWASLHATYSIYGIVAVSLIGFYLSYLRERTGSLLTPIMCHGAYNSLIVLLLVALPQLGGGQG